MKVKNRGNASYKRNIVMKRSNKQLIEECLTLSIKDIKAYSVMEFTINNNYKLLISLIFNKFNDILKVNYNINKHAVNDLINLTRNKRNYGSFQYFFICPACGKQCYKLHIPLSFDDPHFKCRNCHDLTYELRKKHIKSLDQFKDLKLNCKIEQLLSTGNIKDRNKARKLLKSK